MLVFFSGLFFLGSLGYEEKIGEREKKPIGCVILFALAFLLRRLPARSSLFCSVATAVYRALPADTSYSTVLISGCRRFSNHEGKVIREEDV
ncbi:hypothetical protein K1719_002961 [Acacia pycnantha]|nr:hypothetical protein K1719_002961 [Acacia pycnantha]